MHLATEAGHDQLNCTFDTVDMNVKYTLFVVSLSTLTDSYDVNFCVGKVDGHYADPDDCMFHYVCSLSTVGSHASCGPGTIWNQALLVCELGTCVHAAYGSTPGVLNLRFGDRLRSGTLYQRIFDLDILQCVLTCTQIPHCQSANHIDLQPGFVCDLMTDKFTSMQDFWNDQNGIYFEKK